MSLDDRLRRGLEGLDVIETTPSNEMVDSVLRRGQRQRTARRITAGILALAAAIASVVFVPKALEVLRTSGDVRPASPKELLRVLSGNYTIEIAPGGGAVSAYDMAGTWTVELLPTGALEIAPPPAFVRSWGKPTGNTVSVAPGSLRTNAFSSLCGGTTKTYGWTLRGDLLAFEPVRDDVCQVRQVFFASAWTRTA